MYATLQCGPMDIGHDEASVLNLLKATPAGWDVYFSSAYLNPSQALSQALVSAGRDTSTKKGLSEDADNNVANVSSGLSHPGRLELLTAHGDSHGFRGARGLMGCVPGCYQYITDKLVERVAAERAMAVGPGDSWSMLMYRREGWTFHAKGLWSFETPCSGAAGRSPKVGVEAGTGPCVTVVGSSNYGFRSSSLDLESQLVLLTEQPELSGALQGEWNQLRERAVTHTPAADTPWWAPLLSRVLGKLM